MNLKPYEKTDTFLTGKRSPKSQIAQHYINKYNMNITGMTLSIEVPEIIDLINLYDND